MDIKISLYRLMELLLNKSAYQSVDAKTCKAISEDIFNLTRNYISASTIERFFGSQERGAYPSRFVLNSVSQYLGYIDWNDFIKHADDISTANTSK